MERTMLEVYLYNEEADTLQDLSELTIDELVIVSNILAEEVDRRLWDALPSLEADQTVSCETMAQLFNYLLEGEEYDDEHQN